MPGPRLSTELEPWLEPQAVTVIMMCGGSGPARTNIDNLKCHGPVLSELAWIRRHESESRLGVEEDGAAAATPGCQVAVTRDSSKR